MDILTDRFGYSFYFIRVYVLIDSCFRHKKHRQFIPLYMVFISIQIFFGFFCNSINFFSSFVIRIFIILDASNIQICNDRNRHIEVFLILSSKYINISFICSTANINNRNTILMQILPYNFCNCRYQ